MGTDRKTVEDKSAIVIGAGIVGVCSAWHLRRKGFKVTLVDRRQPGEETSYGNAGLIQRECVMPYAFPSSYKERVAIAFNLRDNIRYDPAALVKYWYALFDYWRCSLPRNYDKIARQFATLIEHCIEEHEVMIKASHTERLVRKGGFIESFRTKSMAQIEAIAADTRSRGVSVDVLQPADIQKAEPYVDVSGFTGAVAFTDAWRIVNPGALVKAYANNYISNGGTFVQAAVLEVCPPTAEKPSRWVVRTDRGDLEAANVVIAAGPWSGEVLKALGHYIPLYTLRGYHAHFATTGDAKLNSTFVDVENGLAMSPMEQGLRITTGGEVNLLMNAPQNDIINSCANTVRTFFPLGPQVSSVWYGHRPCMSDMRPVIGSCGSQPGLWVNTGAGHSGFTLGPVTGRLIAELMNNEKPLVDPAPFDPNRFA